MYSFWNMEENTRDGELHAKANKPCYGLFGSTGGHLGGYFFGWCTCTQSIHMHTLACTRADLWTPVSWARRLALALAPTCWSLGFTGTHDAGFFSQCGTQRAGPLINTNKLLLVCKMVYAATTEALNCSHTFFKNLWSFIVSTATNWIKM